MKEVQLEACQRLADALWVAVGRDEGGAPLGLVLPVRPYGSIPYPTAEELPLPDSWSTDVSLGVLTRWCALRMALAARIAVGAEVLVASEAVFASALMAAVRGLGGFPVGHGANLDGALLCGKVAAELEKILARCRKGAVVVLSAVAGLRIDINLYTDFHRRGIELTALRLDRVQADEWLRYREYARGLD